MTRTALAADEPDDYERMTHVERLAWIRAQVATWPPPTSAQKAVLSIVLNQREVTR